MHANTTRQSLWLVCTLTAALALLNIGRMIANGLTDPQWAGFDLHSYWYYGHFVWEGINPYRAFVLRLTPALPIQYWDGAVASAPLPTADVLGNTPANTAPMLWLLAPLARLSWPLARAVWLAINLALLLLSGVLLRRILDPQRQWARPAVLTVLWLPLALAAAQPGVVYGQTVQVVLVAILASYLLRDRHPWAAGVLFGLALAKYSLAIALLPLLLIERRWRLLATALAVQLVALLGVAALDGSSVVDTARAYLVLATLHVDAGGINLAAGWDDPRLSLAAAVAVTLVMIAYLVWTGQWRVQSPDRAAALQIAALGALWSLLAVYHLHYDLLLALLPLLWLLDGTYRRIWRVADALVVPLYAVLIGIAVLLCLPVALLPALAGRGATLLLGALFALTLLLRPVTPPSD